MLWKEVTLHTLCAVWINMASVHFKLKLQVDVICLNLTIQGVCFLYQILFLPQRGKSKRRRRRQLNMSLFPTTTQQPNRLQENCSEAGDPSQYDPNFLHLCKICSSQRVLEDNFYPHLLNEVYCKPSENGCLGNGNGKCAPTIFNIHILKRREDMCRVCIKDQEPLVVNEWEIYNESINVGCECMLNKNSDYRSRWFSQPQSTAYSLNNVGKR